MNISHNDLEVKSFKLPESDKDVQFDKLFCKILVKIESSNLKLVMFIDEKLREY